MLKRIDRVIEKAILRIGFTLNPKNVNSSEMQFCCDTSKNHFLTFDIKVQKYRL